MGRKLKAALTNFQRQAKLQQQKDRKEKHAAQIKVDQKVAQAAKTRANQQRRPREAWIPFAMSLEDYSNDSMVLVGEGDFSFAVDVAEKYPSLPLIATSLDSKEALLTKYPATAQANLNQLNELGVPVVTDVDATQLLLHTQRIPALREAQLGTVMFNFPHLGNSVSDQDRNIRQHQQLMLKFFQQCAACKIPRVVVTLFDGEPYVSWQPKQLARSAGYSVERSGQFPWDEFTKYHHQLTSKGDSYTSKKQSQRSARMYLFVPQNPLKSETERSAKKTRNRRPSESSEDED